MCIPSVAFLDRDGTIICDVNYLSRPEQVELIDGAANAIQRLNVAGVPVIVVTNQSGIARGYFTTADYERGRARLDELLGEHGAHIDGSYFCPHLPSIGEECECRKPAAGLFRTAARERKLDMRSPAFVGDRWRDIAAVRELGGQGFLLRSPGDDSQDVVLARESGVTVVSTLGDAVERMLRGRARIAVLASGAGSNLQAILDHFGSLGDARSGDVVLVASNRSRAPALDRGRAAGVASEHFDAGDPCVLLDLLERHHVDIVALAGYLRLVPANVIEPFRDRIVNVHPGPLPRFGGSGMYGARVHAAVLESGESLTAATVHLVDERFDHGAVLAQLPVEVRVDDTPARLGARVLGAEHIIYPRILDALAATLVRKRLALTD
ncbi:MAG: HAD-IIIA family hydrolase [Gemmatimonadaceae bacterium]